MPDPETAVRAPRHDGWTPERTARFLDSLTARGNVRLACRQAGMSPEAAYRLKRRDPGFARGWAAALVLAHDSGVQILADRAVDGVEEPVWHRGEQVGTRRRFDSRLLLAHLARLDKALEDELAVADAGRFDELVACITGEAAWSDLADEDDALLPLDRYRASVRAGCWAEEALGPGDRPAGGEDGGEAAQASKDDCLRAYSEGRAAGEKRWDAWFDHACCYVDYLTAWDEPPPLPGLPGNPLPEPVERALAQAPRPCENPAKPFAWTLSGSSTSALAASLAGPLARFTGGPPAPRRVRF